jgi:hypothetical protein
MLVEGRTIRAGAEMLCRLWKAKKVASSVYYCKLMYGREAQVNHRNEYLIDHHLKLHSSFLISCQLYICYLRRRFIRLPK